MSEQDNKFDEWLKLVDKRIIEILGVSRDDLPDCPYRDWFDKGLSAKTAASRAIKLADE